jgi:hypothetical protein
VHEGPTAKAAQRGQHRAGASRRCRFRLRGAASRIALLGCRGREQARRVKLLLADVSMKSAARKSAATSTRMHYVRDLQGLAERASAKLQTANIHRYLLSAEIRAEFGVRCRCSFAFIHTSPAQLVGPMVGPTTGGEDLAQT